MLKKLINAWHALEEEIIQQEDVRKILVEINNIFEEYYKKELKATARGRHFKIKVYILGSEV